MHIIPFYGQAVLRCGLSVLSSGPKSLSALIPRHVKGLHGDIGSPAVIVQTMPCSASGM